MKKRTLPSWLPFIISSLLLPLGCGGNEGGPLDVDEPLVLQPSDLCSDYSGSSVATFEDANLEAAHWCYQFHQLL